MALGLERLVARARRGARGAVGLVARGVGRLDALGRALDLGQRRLLGARGLPRPAAISASRRLRSASTRSSPPAGTWRSSRAPGDHTRPSRVTATPRKPRIERVEVVDDPDVGEQRGGEPRGGPVARTSSTRSSRARRGAGRAGGAARGGRRGAGAALAPARRARRRRRGPRGRAAARPRRGRRRPRRAGAGRARRRARARSRASALSASASAGAPPGAPAWARRNWLTFASSAPTRAASRRAASAARSSSRRAPRAASAAASAVLARRPPCASASSPSRARLLGRRGAARLELGDLLREPLGAVLRELLELRLERRDALGGAVVARVVPRPRRASASSAARRRAARSASVVDRLARGLQPHRRSARAPSAPRGSGCSAPRARRRAAASACSACSRRRATSRSSRLGRLGGRARGGDLRLGLGERRDRRARRVARERPARLVGLALEPLVQLGGLGLALERPQPRARLALDVERAVEVVLRAVELELRAAAALAVLAEARRPPRSAAAGRAAWT